MEPLLTAILEDDRLAVKRLLRADSGLATGLVKRARLYPTLHWLYVGDTALHLAAAAYRTQIVASLVAAGADVNAAANHRQGRPLHYAADGCPGEPAYDSKRQVKTIRYLLSAGADVHAQDRNGASALHRAVRTRSAAAVRLLLQSGADPALRNKSGSTPFHLAVQSTGRGGSGTEEARAAQAQIIRTFLSHGVSPNCRDGRGNTVLDCARSEWIKDLFSAIAGG